MDYYAWVEAQRGKTPAVVDWNNVSAETVADSNLSTHTGTVRQTWVGGRMMMTRVVVRPNSRGKAHSHPSEQISMILRGGVRVFMHGKEDLALAGSIVHIPANAVHMFEILGEETEILDVYDMQEGAEGLRKHYPD